MWSLKSLVRWYEYSFLLHTPLLEDKRAHVRRRLRKKVGAMIPWAKYWFCYSGSSCLRNWITVLKLANFKINETSSYLPTYGITFSGKYKFRLLWVIKRHDVVFMFGGKKIHWTNNQSRFEVPPPPPRSAIEWWAGEDLIGRAWWPQSPLFAEEAFLS